MSTLRTKMDKKKAQDVMKRIMAERRTKDKKPLNIDNPLAKFNSAGQLMCILCSSIVRSEHVWTVHINSKQHRENVSKAKQLKERTNNFTLGKLKHKGLSTPTDAPPEKKIKGILKNSSSAPQITTNKSNYVAPSSIPYHSEEIKRQPLNKLAVKSEDLSESKNDEQVTILQTGPDQPIPEGFFDDPILDAKVRNIEYKDPVEEEWEKFQKEIKEEASASADIIAGEQEEATAERQIDEIDEQIRNWSRVLDLELKKEETRKNKQDMEQMSEEENNDSDNEDDIDEFLDWRAKKSYT